MPHRVRNPHEGLITWVCSACQSENVDNLREVDGLGIVIICHDCGTEGHRFFRYDDKPGQPVVDPFGGISYAHRRAAAACRHIEPELLRHYPLEVIVSRAIGHDPACVLVYLLDGGFDPNRLPFTEFEGALVRFVAVPRTAAELDAHRRKIDATINADEGRRALDDLGVTGWSTDYATGTIKIRMLNPNDEGMAAVQALHPDIPMSFRAGGRLSGRAPRVYPALNA